MKQEKKQTKNNATDLNTEAVNTEAAEEKAAESIAASPKDREKLEEPESYEEVIEAILFAAGHPVSYETLAKTFELRGPILRNMVKEYAERYNKSKVPRGVILLAMEKECQLCTKPQYLSYIRAALGIRRNGTLSAANMETLAIVAYHQPVTRAYIDAVRGVDSSYAVSSLVERGLIENVGRLDAPGRPMLFGTSTGFLRCFGLNSIDDLPDLSNEEITQVFRQVEERMEKEAADSDVDPNQLTIEDAEVDETGEKETNAEESTENIAEESMDTELSDSIPELVTEKISEDQPES